jgi:hypothetical protein
MAYPIRLAACLAVNLALSACAADQGRYPSLARRPAERISGSSAVVAPAPALLPEIAASPELAGRLGQLVGRIETVHQRFLARRPAAAARVSAAAGAAVASDSWSVATIALADLESTRSEAMIALADLDAMWVTARIAGEEAPALAAARDHAIALIGQEDAILAGLRGRMRG